MSDPTAPFEQISEPNMKVYILDFEILGLLIEVSNVAILILF